MTLLGSLPGSPALCNSGNRANAPFADIIWFVRSVFSIPNFLLLNLRDVRGGNPHTIGGLVNRHFATIEELEEAQLARCAALRQRPDLMRPTTCFPWWGGPANSQAARPPGERRINIGLV